MSIFGNKPPEGGSGSPLGANQRLVLGVIGTGDRGIVLLKNALSLPGVAVAAVCDVDNVRCGRALELAGPGARGYHDFRDLLDRSDIDAVIVATPDHWHALQTIRACEAGKDVYCEKPLSHTVPEGRAMVQAAERHGRVVQVGTQHRMDDDIRTACELIRSGRIGDVKRVDMWMWENPQESVTPPSPPPPSLDWDLWLGPAAYVLYHPKRAHFNFRWFRDYSGGYLTDWGTHMVNVVTWALGADAAIPVEVEGAETPYEQSLYEFPATQTVRWTFSDPNFVLTWRQPKPPEETERYGIRFHGSQGVMEVWFGKHRLLRNGQEVASEPPVGSAPGDVELPRAADNLTNWIECIRSRTRPINDILVGHQNATVCNIGSIAARLGRKLRWDANRERFVDDDEANRLLSYEYRSPWQLG